MTLTSDGKVYSWGQNDLEVLGNGNKSCEIIEPIIRKCLINEAIVDMSCGAYHSMV
jgi:alpha-tubulin suppressor-like RCC1 family protein